MRQEAQAVLNAQRQRDAQITLQNQLPSIEITAIKSIVQDQQRRKFDITLIAENFSNLTLFKINGVMDQNLNISKITPSNTSNKKTYQFKSITIPLKQPDSDYSDNDIIIDTATGLQTKYEQCKNQFFTSTSLLRYQLQTEMLSEGYFNNPNDCKRTFSFSVIMNLQDDLNQSL